MNKRGGGNVLLMRVRTLEIRFTSLVLMLALSSRALLVPKDGSSGVLPHPTVLGGGGISGEEETISWVCGKFYIWGGEGIVDGKGARGGGAFKTYCGLGIGLRRGWRLH